MENASEILLVADPSSTVPLSPPTWVPAASVTQCFGCNTTFTFIKRKHHCRGCGGVLCSHCLTLRRPLPHYGFKDKVRVCIGCASPIITSCSSPSTAGGIITLSGFNLTIPDDDNITHLHRNDNITSSPVPINYRNSTGKKLEKTPTATSLFVAVTIDSTLGRSVNLIKYVNKDAIGSMITCYVFPGEGIEKEVTVNICGLLGRCKMNYLPPVINHIDNIPTTGGVMVISGDNFGSNVHNINVFIKDGEKCSNIYLSIRHKVIQVNIPPGIGTNLPIIVQVGGQLSEPAMFSYYGPEILQLTDPPLDGGQIHIAGRNFGACSSDIHVFVNKKLVTSQLIVPHTTITAHIPPAKDLKHGLNVQNTCINIRLQVGSQFCEATVFYEGCGDNTLAVKQSQRSNLSLSISSPTVDQADASLLLAQSEPLPLSNMGSKKSSSSSLVSKHRHLSAEKSSGISGNAPGWALVNWLTSLVGGDDGPVLRRPVRNASELSLVLDFESSSKCSPRSNADRSQISDLESEIFATPLERCSEAGDVADEKHRQSTLISLSKRGLFKTISEPDLTSLCICCRCSAPFSTMSLRSTVSPFCKRCEYLVCFTSFYGVVLSPPPDKDSLMLLNCLHNACFSGHLNVVRKLLALGADVNSLNDELYGAMHYAAAFGNVQVTDELIHAGASVSIIGANGFTPLHVAASYGNMDMIKALIRYGSNVSQLTSTGMSPAQVATASNHGLAAAYLSNLSDKLNNLKSRQFQGSNFQNSRKIPDALTRRNFNLIDRNSPSSISTPVSGNSLIQDVRSQFFNSQTPKSGNSSQDKRSNVRDIKTTAA